MRKYVWSIAALLSMLFVASVADAGPLCGKHGKKHRGPEFMKGAQVTVENTSDGVSILILAADDASAKQMQEHFTMLAERKAKGEFPPSPPFDKPPVPSDAADGRPEGSAPELPPPPPPEMMGPGDPAEGCPCGAGCGCDKADCPCKGKAGAAPCGCGGDCGCGMGRGGFGGPHGHHGGLMFLLAPQDVAFTAAAVEGGVTVSVTSTDPEKVKMIQEHARIMAERHSSVR